MIGSAKPSSSRTKYVHRIEEKASAPPGKNRFSRKNSSQAIETKAVEQVNLTDADMCKQMLADGYIQSYIDFYHLTHRSDMTTPLERSDVVLIRNYIVRAEESRRKGDTRSVHQSYMKLASLYSNKLKDWKTSIFFYEKCYELSLLTADKLAEMSANHHLGIIYQQMREISTARSFHEKHEALALELDNSEEVARANVELHKVYFTLAQQRDEEDSFDRALELYTRSLRAAKLASDRAAEAEANGRVGAILIRKEDMAAAIPFLRAYSQISTDLNDSENRCHASSLLAAALDSLGMTEKALIELKLVSTVSEQAGDAMLQSQACLALGKLASKIGKFDEAYEALQRHFDLLKSLSIRVGASGPTKDKSSSASANMVGSKELDTARVFLGISRGNKMMKAYVHAIEFDFSALLDWKLTRNDHITKV